MQFFECYWLLVKWAVGSTETILITKAGMMGIWLLSENKLAKIALH